MPAHRQINAFITGVVETTTSLGASKKDAQSCHSNYHMLRLL